jgi:hypothetical protein
MQFQVKDGMESKMLSRAATTITTIKKRLKIKWEHFTIPMPSYRFHRYNPHDCMLNEALTPLTVIYCCHS